MVRWLYASTHLVPVGRLTEAIQQLDRALQEDPLSQSCRAWRALVLYAVEREEEASEEAGRLLELYPGSTMAYAVVALGYVLRGKMAEALPLQEKAHALPPSDPTRVGQLAGALQLTGDARRAEEILGTLPADAFGGPRARAVFHWVCGDVDATVDWLEKAIDQRDPVATFLPRLRYGRGELRSTPQWPRLMRKLNLPET